MGRHGMWRGLRNFAGASGGNVAIIFAAVMIPVSGIAAAAIDFGRAGNVRNTLQMAASAAAQAGSAHLDECAFRARRPLVPAHGDHPFQGMATSGARRVRGHR